MNAILLTISSLIVAGLIALFAIPPFVDWNTYRGVFEEEASRILGRQVRVGGNVDLRLLPQPYVRFQQVVIADEPGVVGEPLLRVGNFKMRLAVPPLLSGRIEAREVAIDQARLRLRIDKQGKGNWQKLRLGSSASSFAPNAVAFQRVIVNDAEIALEGADGNVKGRIANVSGEFSAPAIAGPYKFVGEARLAGHMRDVRISTATWDAESNGTAVKLTVRERTGSGRLSFDGDVAIKDGANPLVEGQITATSANNDRLGDGRARSVEVKGGLRADNAGAELRDLTVSFERGGRPQLLTGTAQTTFDDDPVLRVDLKSRWLDIDQISGVEQDNIALTDVLAASLTQMSGIAFDGFGPINLSLGVKQATVARSSVSLLRFDGVVSPKGIQIDRLVGTAPGRTQLRLDGEWTNGGPAAQKFEGVVLAEGANAPRFAEWAWGTSLFGDHAQAQPQTFALSSKVALQAQDLSLTDARARLGQSRFSGRVSFVNRPGGGLSVELTGSDVDLSAIAPDALSPAALSRLFGLEARDTSAASDTGPDLGLRIVVRAGRLSDEERVYRDVNIDVEKSRDGLTISTLELKTDDGLHLNGRGVVNALGSRAPSADAKGVIGVATPQARDTLLGLVSEWGGAPDAALPQHLPVPADLAFAISNSGADAGLTLEASGTIEGHRVALTAVSDGRTIDALSGSQLRLNATGTTAALATPLRWLGLKDGSINKRDRPMQSPNAKPARFIVRAAGVPSEGLASFASVTRGNERIAFSGTAAIKDGALGEVSGDVTVIVDDAAVLAAGTGLLARSDLVDGVPVNARVEVDATSQSAQLTVLDSTFGTLAGYAQLNVAVAGGNGPGRSVSGTVNLGPTRLQVLSNLVLAGPQQTTESSRRTDSDEPAADTLWPSRRFDLRVAKNWRLDVNVNTTSLEIMTDLALADASFRLRTKPGTVEISRIKGAGPAGADVDGQLRLVSDAAGAIVSGRLKLSNVTLAPLRTGASQETTERRGEPWAQGRVATSLSFEGNGISPAAVLGLLQGQGEVRFEQLSAKGLAPRAVEQSASQMLSAIKPGEDTELEMAELVDALRGNLAQSHIDIGTGQLAIDVSDGVARLATLSRKTNTGRVRNATTIDLSRMVFDSRWTLTTQPDVDGRQWPAISAVFAGDLGDVARIQPSLDVDALHRDLVVRRMEANVAELERLRRGDAARPQNGAQGEDSERDQPEAGETADAGRRRGGQSGPWSSGDRPDDAADPSPFGSAPVIRAPLPAPAGPRSEIDRDGEADGAHRSVGSREHRQTRLPVRSSSAPLDGKQAPVAVVGQDKQRKTSTVATSPVAAPEPVPTRRTRSWPTPRVGRDPAQQARRGRDTSDWRGEILFGTQ